MEAAEREMYEEIGVAADEWPTPLVQIGKFADGTHVCAVFA